MTKEENNIIDFEEELINSLRSRGYLFPANDVQMEYFMAHSDPVPLPEKYQTPDFIFDDNFINFAQLVQLFHNDEHKDIDNWAIAARHGKKIPQSILDKMKEDRKKSQE